MATTLLFSFSSHQYKDINVIIYWSIRGKKTVRGQGQLKCITVGFYVSLLMDVSAVWMVLTTESKTTTASARHRPSEELSDRIDLSGRPLNTEPCLINLNSQGFLFFLHVLTCTCPLEPFAELLRCSAQPSYRGRKIGNCPWRCTIKLEFIDKLCVS